jgi:hypothetical protein
MAVGEAMICFKGHFALKQYMPGKPMKQFLKCEDYVRKYHHVYIMKILL